MYIAVAVSIAALLVVTNAQIPNLCADRDSLVNLECCPKSIASNFFRTASGALAPPIDHAHQ